MLGEQPIPVRLVTTDPTWTVVGSKKDLRGDWPGINGINPGTVVHSVGILEVASGITCRSRHRSASRPAERNCFCDPVKISIAFRSSGALECRTTL